MLQQQGPPATFSDLGFQVVITLDRFLKRVFRVLGLNGVVIWVHALVSFGRFVRRGDHDVGTSTATW